MRSSRHATSRCCRSRRAGNHAVHYKIGDTMEVILKEDIDKLGHRGDVVKVADGYGRNYLLPEKLAIEATAANKSVIEQMKHSAVRKLAKEKGEAEELAKHLDAIELVFERKAGESEH